MESLRLLLSLALLGSAAAYYEITGISQQEIHVKQGEAFEVICTADNYYEVSSMHALRYVAMQNVVSLQLSMKLTGNPLTTNFPQLCTFKHAKKMCEIESVGYDVKMGDCSDYEGRVEFRVSCNDPAQVNNFHSLFRVITTSTSVV
jgi:hypothetical protein